MSRPYSCRQSHMPVAHRVARWLAARGVPGARYYWGAAERITPLAAEVAVTLPGGVTVPIDTADWMATNIYRGLYERAEVHVVARLLDVGDTVIDVGANIGLYSVVAAHAVGGTGRVVAYEPLPETHRLLAATIERHRLAQVEPVPAAATDVDGPIELRLASDAAHTGLATLRELGPPDGYTVHVIDGERLDTRFGEDRVDEIALLKIDAEGAEGQVLRGARDLLDAGAVRALLFELAPSFPTTVDLLVELERLADDYAFFVLVERGVPRTPRLVPSTVSGLRDLDDDRNILALRRRDAAALVARATGRRPRRRGSLSS